MKLLIIGVCIGFVIGNIVGVVLMSIMAAASREDRAREYNELLNKHTQELTEVVEKKDDYNTLVEKLDKIYMLLNDHMLEVAPDERTPDSEYEFRKGIAIGVQQSLNCLVDLVKPKSEVDELSKILFYGKCPYTSKECEKWTCRSCEVEKAERDFADEGI